MLWRIRQRVQAFVSGSLLENRLATTDTPSAWGGRSLRAGEADETLAGRAARAEDSYDDALADEPKWPAWKVTVAVVVFCTACWAGIGYLAVRLLG